MQTSEPTNMQTFGLPGEPTITPKRVLVVDDEARLQWCTLITSATTAQDIRSSFRATTFPERPYGSVVPFEVCSGTYPGRNGPSIRSASCRGVLPHPPRAPAGR